MKIKTMLIAASAVMVLAFAAVPSMAAAFTTTPTLDPPGEKFPAKFKGTSPAGILFGATEIKCEKDTNVGEFENNMTGKATITFINCHEQALGTACTTTGQANGTIKTELLPTHLVYLKPANASLPHERPGILFTPAANGIFAKFACAGGLIGVEVKGKGVLGTITSPALGVESETAKINVAATKAGQQHTETVEGEKFGLEASVGGGALAPVFEEAGESTITFEGGKAKLTTE